MLGLASNCRGDGGAKHDGFVYFNQKLYYPNMTIILSKSTVEKSFCPDAHPGRVKKSKFSQSQSSFCQSQRVNEASQMGRTNEKKEKIWIDFIAQFWTRDISSYFLRCSLIILTHIFLKLLLITAAVELLQWPAALSDGAGCTKRQAHNICLLLNDDIKIKPTRCLLYTSDAADE